MRSYALLLVLLLVPASAAAQEGSSLVVPDARVRMLLAPPEQGWVSGRVHSVSADSVYLRRGDALQPVSLAAAQRLEVGRGRKRLLWTAGGALAGAAVGVIYSRATLDDDPADIGGVQNTAEGLANTITGALFGGVLGYFVAPQRWLAVPLPLR